MAGRGGSNTTEKGGPQHYCLSMSTYEGIKKAQVRGIEPLPTVLETVMLPLHNTHTKIGASEGVDFRLKASGR